MLSISGVVRSRVWHDERIVSGVSTVSGNLLKRDFFTLRPGLIILEQYGFCLGGAAVEDERGEPVRGSEGEVECGWTGLDWAGLG